MINPRLHCKWVENLDTTLGADADQIITMTTIFRTKGLEYDYVILPDCVDGYLPSNYDTDLAIFDTQGIIRDPEPTPHIESGTRLFYVALTRAREGGLYRRAGGSAIPVPE